MGLCCINVAFVRSSAAVIKREMLSRPYCLFLCQHNVVASLTCFCFLFSSIGEAPKWPNPLWMRRQDSTRFRLWQTTSILYQCRRLDLTARFYLPSLVPVRENHICFLPRREIEKEETSVYFPWLVSHLLLIAMFFHLTSGILSHCLPPPPKQPAQWLQHEAIIHPWPATVVTVTTSIASQDLLSAPVTWAKTFDL